MTIIKPISDLRNNFSKISETCHTQGEPIFLTKNGRVDLVVMSLATYEKQEALIELYQKLAVAEQQSVADVRTMSHKEVISKLRKKIND